jgi:DegV family protein with EDD domain
LIKIITDSTSDIPEALIKQYGINVVPLTVNFIEKSYKDGVELTGDEFFEKLAASEEMPTTSQVSIGEFVEVFEKELETSKDILCVNISSDLSGTYNAAMQAKEHMGNEHVHVVDSRLVSFALGVVVVEAARKLEQGVALEEVIDYLEHVHEDMQNIFIFDTLEYLLKGGRLSKNEALLGNLLNIKPILTIEDGALKSRDKIRGRKKAIKYAIKQVMADYEKQPFKKIAIFQSADSQMMKEIRTRLEEEFDFDEILESKIGSVVGTHSGPGCAALSYIY